MAQTTATPSPVLAKPRTGGRSRPCRNPARIITCALPAQAVLASGRNLVRDKLLSLLVFSFVPMVRVVCPMSRGTRNIVVGTIAACIIGLVVFGVATGHGRTMLLKYQAGEICKQIEEFRSKSGRLPDSIEEMGIPEKEEGPIYYKKKSSTNYILWFGEGLGSSCVYDSKTKTWRETG